MIKLFITKYIIKHYHITRILIILHYNREYIDKK